MMETNYPLLLDRQTMRVQHNAAPETAMRLKESYLMGFEHGYLETVYLLRERIAYLEQTIIDNSDTLWKRIRNWKYIRHRRELIEETQRTLRYLRIFQDTVVKEARDRIVVENVHPVIPLNTNGPKNR
jgi:hypothetical protein